MFASIYSDVHGHGDASVVLLLLACVVFSFAVVATYAETANSRISLVPIGLALLAIGLVVA